MLKAIHRSLICAMAAWQASRLAKTELTDKNKVQELVESFVTLGFRSNFGMIIVSPLTEAEQAQAVLDIENRTKELENPAAADLEFKLKNADGVTQAVTLSRIEQLHAHVEAHYKNGKVIVPKYGTVAGNRRIMVAEIANAVALKMGGKQVPDTIDVSVETYEDDAARNAVNILDNACKYTGNAELSRGDKWRALCILFDTGYTMKQCLDLLKSWAQKPYGVARLDAAYPSLGIRAKCNDKPDLVNQFNNKTVVKLLDEVKKGKLTLDAGLPVATQILKEAEDKLANGPVKGMASRDSIQNLRTASPLFIIRDIADYLDRDEIGMMTAKYAPHAEAFNKLGAELGLWKLV